MRHAAGKENMNKRLRGWLFTARLALGPRLQPEEIIERQSEAADETYVKEGAAGRALEVCGIIVPGSGYLWLHDSSSPLDQGDSLAPREESGLTDGRWAWNRARGIEPGGKGRAS